MRLTRLDDILIKGGATPAEIEAVMTLVYFTKKHMKEFVTWHEATYKNEDEELDELLP